MPHYTNNHNISLLMAVWLAHSTYDMTPATNKISVTTLLKSVRQIILGKRVTGKELSQDISELINARLGQSIHAGIEQAWQDPKAALLSLGYAQALVDRVVVNPTTWGGNDIPVWIELRTEMPLGNWILSGETDAILMGAVHDVKSTGIFAYTTGSNNSKYRDQMSLYRLLNQDKVTKDMGYIEYYFKDWDKLEAGYKTNYPPFPVYNQPIPLRSVLDTEKYARDKLALIELHWDSPEPDLPQCSPEDLWQSQAKWQYFGSSKNQKASKNFDTELEAQQWMHAKGKGVIRYNAGKAKACKFCSARPNCSQFAALNAANMVVL